MAKLLSYSICIVLLCGFVLNAEQVGEPPFASVEKAIKEEPGGCASPLSRPMGSVASGVEELRVRDRSGAYRVFY